MGHDAKGSRRPLDCTIIAACDLGGAGGSSSSSSAPRASKAEENLACGPCTQLSRMVLHSPPGHAIASSYGPRPVLHSASC